MQYILSLLAKDDERDLVTGLLALHYPSGWQEETLLTGEERFLVRSESKTDLVALAQTLTGYLPTLESTMYEEEDVDWLAHWKNFPPVRRGRFLVLTPWDLPKNQDHQAIVVSIEPKNAFGTGQHETTALCLDLISDFGSKAQAGSSDYDFLDLGCGSGILGICAAKLGFRGLCLDIDPDCLRNTQENARANGVEDALTIGLGSIDEAPKHSFQMIFANILAKPLIDMANPITEALLPHAVLILSGLLTSQEDAVRTAYEACQLTLLESRHEGEWCALVFQK